MKPQRIFLIRHGESLANIERSIYYKLPGFKIPLTDDWKKQAVECGKRLKEKLVSKNILFYLSPYLRTKQTFEEILSQLGNVQYKVREEPRIREQDFGKPRDQHVDYSLDPDYENCGAFFIGFRMVSQELMCMIEFRLFSIHYIEIF